MFPPNHMGGDPFMQGGMEGPFFPGMMMPPGGMMLPGISTHPINTLYLHIPTTPSFNIPINPCYQQTLLTHPIYTPS